MAKHAIVLGGGLAGMLSAAALVTRVDRVTVIERDTLPNGPEARKGVPQARHAHMLMSSGARAMDLLIPGLTDRILAAGGHRISLRTGIVSNNAHGWVPRTADLQYLITCGRPLLDGLVRERVLATGRVTVRQETDVVGLLGDATRVTGARIREHNSGEVTDLSADFVVDATGRGSNAGLWLVELGLPRVREVVVDSGLSYSTQVFRAPLPEGASFPAVNILPVPGEQRPSHAGALLPIEDGRWIVTISGLRGAELPNTNEEFVAFARGLRHSVIGDLIADAEPIGPVHRSRSTANRRRLYEELPQWPAGFVVLGDATAAFNPVYGHGMSVAAKSVLALRTALDRDGFPAPAGALALQRTISESAAVAWALATGQDQRYPNAGGEIPAGGGLAARLLRGYMSRVSKASVSRLSVASAMADVFTLSAPLSRLTEPKVVLAALLGPTEPSLAEPPFTPEERKLFSQVLL